MVKFKEFLVGDLFEITNGGRVTKQEQEVGTIPYVTAATSNNGVESYISNPKFTKTNIITVNFFGDTYYHPYKIGYKDGTYGLELKGTKSKEIYLYLTSVLNKRFKCEGSYSKMLTGSAMSGMLIKLPITPEGTPDYAYMENYIKEMQREYIDSVLEANSIERNRLLSIVGLDQAEYERVKGNIELEDAESYGEFKVGDLFEIEPTKYYKDLRDEEIKNKEGSTPFITTQNTNNGIAGYSILDAINKGNTITASDTTSDDAIFYQEKDFIGRSHVQNIMPKKGVPFNKNISMYIITCMRKSAKGLYDYGNKFNRDNMRKTSLLLPITSTGELDYAYMEDYISKIKLIYIYNRELSVNEQVRLLESLLKGKELVAPN